MTEVHLVISVWRGVFNEAKAFNDVERARNHKRKLDKEYPNSNDFDVNVISVEVE